jgi:hypothetical protein
MPIAKLRSLVSSGTHSETLVYFLRESLEGPVKVGRSKDPWSRRDQLQTGNPKELRVLGCCFGNPEFENAIHQAFKDAHIRGEWFRSTEDLVSLINEICPFSNDDWMTHVDQYASVGCTVDVAHDQFGSHHCRFPESASTGFAIWMTKWECRSSKNSTT